MIPEAVIANIKHVANGVLVIDVSIAAIKLMTVIGDTKEFGKPGAMLLSPRIRD